MTDYSKKSWVDFRKCLQNPPDTPDYIKAKEERDHRIKRYALVLTVAGIIVTVAIKIFSR